SDALPPLFIENVSAAGPFPAIRVGDQPYGILPVTAVHMFRPAAGEGIDATLVPVVQTIPRISETMRFVTTRCEDLLIFTGRPNTFIEARLAPGTPVFSEWVGKAT